MIDTDELHNHIPCGWRHGVTTRTAGAIILHLYCDVEILHALTYILLQENLSCALRQAEVIIDFLCI